MPGMESLGIVLENGMHNLKQIADFVTKSSIENGIEYALKQHGMI